MSEQERCKGEGVLTQGRSATEWVPCPGCSDCQPEPAGMDELAGLVREAFMPLSALIVADYGMKEEELADWLARAEKALAREQEA